MLGSSNGVTRRRVLGAVESAVAGGLAGCGSRIPAARSPDFDFEHQHTDTAMRWVYPANSRDPDIGTAAVAFERVQLDEGREGWQLEFSVSLDTTGDGESASGYRYDLVRFRLWPSAAYEAVRNYDVRTGLPLPEGLKLSVHEEQNFKQIFVLEIDEFEPWMNSITIPAVFDPRDAPRVPAVFHCDLTVQVSKPGLLGNTAHGKKGSRARLDLRQCQPDC